MEVNGRTINLNCLMVYGTCAKFFVVFLKLIAFKFEIIREHSRVDNYLLSGVSS